MTMMFDSAMVRLQEAIQGTARKQALHARNIANASTPGYNAVEFSDELKMARKRKQQGLEAQGFSLEKEMGALAQVNLDHSAYTKLLTTKLGILKTIIAVGKK